MTDFLKAEQLGSAKWRVLAIPFGGEFQGGKDSDGEFFSQRTDIKPKWFPERPVLFQHGMDPVLKDDVIGVLDELELDDLGWWGNVWLDRSHAYHAQIDALLRSGKMFGSSGALGHLVRKATDGEILVWPIVEETLTPTPANRLARVEPAKAIADFTSAGMLTEAVKAAVATDLEAETAELPVELPTGGDAAAIQRLGDDRLPAHIKALLERHDITL